MTRLRLLAIAALPLLLSSNAWADLRTFEVAPQYQHEIYTALRDILNPQGTPTLPFGRVELLPTGQILVNASPETLVQVEQVLEAIRARPVDGAPRAELRYWALLGARAPMTNGWGTAPPGSLNEVLGELRALHGDLQFRVIGTSALTTESGQRGSIDGTALEVEQTVFIQGEAMNASIVMQLEGPMPVEGNLLEGNFRIGSIEVRTALRRGEFVVLGQSELAGRGVDGPVFFIVHWPEG